MQKYLRVKSNMNCMFWLFQGVVTTKYWEKEEFSANNIRHKMWENQWKIYAYKIMLFVFILLFHYTKVTWNSELLKYKLGTKSKQEGSTLVFLLYQLMVSTQQFNCLSMQIPKCYVVVQQKFILWHIVKLKKHRQSLNQFALSHIINKCI